MRVVYVASNISIGGLVSTTSTYHRRSMYPCEYTYLYDTASLLNGLQSYLSIYVAIVAMVVAFFAVSTIVYAVGCIRASRSIHDTLVKSLLTSTFRYAPC
jgi:hypothetical protein